MAKMLVSRQYDGRAARQRAVDVGIVLGIVEERPEFEPGHDQLSAPTHRVGDDIDL
jgi:hypothetical protein